jgi:hypothetical protein
VKIEHAGAAAIEIEKRDGSWRLIAPLTTRADPYQVDRVLDVVNATSKQKLAATDQAGYGLNPPQVRVTLNDQTFSFGRVNDVTNEQYLAVAGEIHLVAPLYGYAIPAEAIKLVSRRILGDKETPVAFDFGNHRVVRDESGRWTIEGVPEGANDKPLSQDDFNRWAEEWRMTSSLDAQPYKGPRGKERLVIRFKEGGSVTMDILQKQPNFLLVRTDEAMRHRFGAEVGRRLLDPRVVAAP